LREELIEGLGHIATAIDGTTGERAFPEWARTVASQAADALTSARAETEELKGDDEQSYQIGKQEGYESAVQEIDVLTGGDGEYRFCTNRDPERHTPDPAAMKARIIERFAATQAALTKAEAELDEAREVMRAMEMMLAEPGGVVIGARLQRDMNRDILNRISAFLSRTKDGEGGSSSVPSTETFAKSSGGVSDGSAPQHVDGGEG
jgi:hypothetical protein